MAQIESPRVLLVSRQRADRPLRRVSLSYQEENGRGRAPRVVKRRVSFW